MAVAPWIVSDVVGAGRAIAAEEAGFRYPGRKPLPDSQALQGILFVLHTGIAWRHPPLEFGFGSRSTCYRLMVSWQQQACGSGCTAPPAVAEDVAHAVSDHGFQGLYLEGNAIAPARCERIAALLAQAGAQVVDGAVIGSNQLRLYLSPSQMRASTANESSAPERKPGAGRQRCSKSRTPAPSSA